MTQGERNKFYIARCLINGKMTISEAALVSGLSERQVKRLKKGVKEHGESFVIHKNRGYDLARLAILTTQSLNVSGNFNYVD